MSNHATITGNLGSDPELRLIPSGKAVATISVGDTPRKFNRDTNAWEDAGETLWLRCTIWGDVAESVASELKRGDKVTVEGRLKARSWEDKNGGGKRSVIEMDADTVAKVVRPAPAARTQTPQQGDDPWATPPAQGGWGSQPPKGGAGWGAPATDEPPF